MGGTVNPTVWIVCVWVVSVCPIFLTESLKWSGEGSMIPHGKHVVCYIGTWSVYRFGRGSFKIEDVPHDLCTHIVYAFVGINSTTNTLRSIDPYYDLEENYGRGSFKRMTQLKSKNPNLKVTLAVGGWNEGSLNYSTMALTADSRRSFIASVIGYVTKYNFDGFDLDWEYPTQRGGRAEDRENFVLLVKELKTELKKYNLILTAALGASPEVMDKAYNIREISKYLDLIHFMCYDYHGPWDPTIGPNAPLDSSDNLNLRYSVEYILKLGAPADKVVLGIPAYGHTFLTNNSIDSGLGSPVSGPGPEGVFSKQAGFQGYNEICLLIAGGNWSLYWDKNSSTPFAVNGNHVVSYDDERSVAEKIKLGMKFKLGGFMVWSIDTDDFQGDCERARHSGASEGTDQSAYSYPLLKAIHRAIQNYSQDGRDDGNDLSINEVTENRIASASSKTLVTFVPFLLIVCVILDFKFQF